ncbi:hypothetical protein [Lysinibacillus sp. LZ02]|uniref:hypothetical protein n=1 Tax=Lysinibacillus sp. LZ02 TaxID=3420668 RepID=UPI003D35E1D9
MMREAFHFYKDVHRQYLWLHVIYAMFLIMTSMFWFVLPFYIVNYGDYEPTLPLKFVCIIFLCIFPSIIVTFHCWFISFTAAKRWRDRRTEESVIGWLIRFQAMAFSIVVVYICIIYSLFLIIDFLR